MKKIILIAAILILTACSSSKNTGDKWVGMSKQSLVKSWGTPVRIFDNNADGEILVYADQIFDNSHRGMAGSNYWNYTYMYIDKNGKVSSYRNEKQNFPPQAIDSNKLIDLKLVTVI